MMKPKRKSIRLKGFDYSRPGFYFITICTQHHSCLFGEIKNDEIVTNNVGKMVNKWWQELEKKYATIQLHQSITMPNHFHGIIQIINPSTPVVGADLCVCPDNTDECTNLQGGHTGPPLPQVVQWFKTMTTNDYMRQVKQNGWSLFPDKLWQRNYYEHVIRNEKSFHDISEYIINNPKHWEKDRYYQSKHASQV